MRGVVMHAPGDVRVEDREDPRIVDPTDAVIRLTASCICGSDLWPYRGVAPVDHQAMGHEYVGIVEEIGSEVKTLNVGDFGVGWFGAVAAEAGPGKTVAVVGDGAVGLMAVLAAKELGAERIVIFSRHQDRQELAHFYGATDIIEARGDE